MPLCSSIDGLNGLFTPQTPSTRKDFSAWYQEVREFTMEICRPLAVDDCGAQSMMEAGSCATSISHIRPTYRNFFPAGAQRQFTGIRLARNL